MHFSMVIDVLDVFWTVYVFVWCVFHVFLTIFKGFGWFSVHFEGFFRFLMVFDVFPVVLYDFLGIFDDF